MALSHDLGRALAAATAVGAIFAGAPAATAETGPNTPPACLSLDIPLRPAERVWCTTPHATLVIAHQSDPVLLEGTEVRVLNADLAGSDVSVRLRVRNTTDAEQGLSAGGQELYLYLAGQRIDVAVLEVIRFGVGEAKTLTLRYPLTVEQAATLRARNGRIDFGVRPWTDQVLPAPLIGVVRVGVGGA